MAEDPHNSISQTLNDAPLGLFHFRAVVTAGMGFFTDAYDLFIIGAALVLIKQQWHPSSSLIGWIGSSALIAAFVGALVFGRLADLLGRKKIYGVEALLMVIGSILSAVSPNMGWLLVARFIMGIGIGGDYPVSAVLMSEYANTKDRGKLVSLVFSMQALGLVAGPIVALTLLASGLNSSWSWRIMLGLGAIPALAVISLRRKLPESPRYMAQVKGQAKKAARHLRAIGGLEVVNITDDIQSHGTLKTFLTDPRYMRLLLGTAGSWFLFDYAYYGNSISLPWVLKALAPHSSTVTAMAWSLIIFTLAALPGYILSFAMIDRIGHRRLQIVGFLMMGLSFIAIGLIPGLTTMAMPFLLLFGVSYFFAEFGPNTTTFVLAAELYPTYVRTTGHGISAGVAKIGAFIGVFVFPLLTQRVGLHGTLLLTGVFSLSGLLLTTILPEPAGRSLEEMAEPIPKKVTQR